MEHIRISLAHQKEGQILNDLVKFAGLVKSSKHYLSFLFFLIFIVVPCILIILKLFSPTNAHFIEHIKC
jgi:hypothetical protein